MLLRCGLFILFANSFFLAGAYCAQKNGLELGRIVVSKNKVYPQDSFSLKQAEFKKLPFDSWIESLNLTPLDLQARSPFGGIQDDFSLRGSTFQGVLILKDGQGINDPQTAHHNADIPLTSEDIERIEVIPGVSSSVFGPDAIGGAVNIIRKRPAQNKISWQAKGGQHKAWSQLFSATARKNAFGARVSVEHEESGGFSEDTDFKKTTASLNTSLELPNTEFKGDFGYQEKEFGAFDFYTPGLNYPSKEWTKTYLLDCGAVFTGSRLMIKPNILWRRHYDRFLLDKTLSRSTYLNRHRTDVLTPNIYLQAETATLGKLGLGAEYGLEDIDSTNLGKHMRHHQSVFLDGAKDLNDRMSLGASYRFDNFNTFGATNTGSINLRHHLNAGQAISFGISRTMRIPSFTELYYNDPVTLGNDSLSSEKAVNYQLGYNYKKQALSLGAVFFLRDEKDFIDWVKHSLSQAKWQAENITRDKVYGVEGSLNWKAAGSLELSANYTYINKTIDETGLIYKYGQNWCRHLAQGSFIFDLAFGQQSLTFSYKKKPGRRGWVILNTHFSCGFFKKAQVFLDITNLLDIDYQEIEGIPSPGRWLQAGLRIDW